MMRGRAVATLASLILAVSVASGVTVSKAATDDCSNCTWLSGQFYNGQSASYFPPATDLGVECYPLTLDTGETRYYLVFTGPGLSGPVTGNNFWKLPAQSEFPLYGTDVSTLNGLDRWNQYMYGNSTGNEDMFYIPYVYFNNAWHGAWNSLTGTYQWMLTQNFTPGGYGYQFWRANENPSGGWEEPEQGGFDITDMGAGFGVNWEWDSMFVPSAGTYDVGGYVYWNQYTGSDNGFGPFPGEQAFFESDYTVTCGGTAIPSRISAPTSVNSAPAEAPVVEAAPPATSQAGGPTPMTTTASVRTRLRAGKVFAIGSLASVGGQVIEGGSIYCEANYGHLHHNTNDSELLPSLHQRMYAQYHQQTGMNVCAWNISSDRIGQQFNFAMHLVKKSGDQTVVSSHLTIK